MQVARVLAGLCVLTSTALADSTWDRTYQGEGRGGDWLCPDGKGDVVVTNGTFAIPWNVQYGNGKIAIGRITANVRASGLVVDLKTTLAGSLPEEVTKERELLDRIVREMKLKFDRRRTKAELSLAANNCYARWVAVVDADEKTFDGPTKVKLPETETLPPPPPLPGSGSAKWNGTYRQRSAYGSDWRCLASSAVKTIAIAKGKLSIPWRVTGGYGSRELEPIQVGQLDGLIAPDGSVKLRVSMMVKALPPELADGLPAGETTLAYLQKAVPTVKLVSDQGKDNPKGQGRRIEIAYGKACTIELAETGYKVQAAREEDGWRVRCNSNAWDKAETYDRGDETTIATTKTIRHLYRCTASDCKGKPGKSNDWEKLGRCER